MNMYFDFELHVVITHSLTHSSLCHQVLDASTRYFHLARSAATLGAVSMDRLLLLRYLRAVLLQVSFGRPLFLFPWGVHLGNELGGMRRT